MKFSFSTIGCPDWSLDDIVSTASDFGYDGVELRGIGKHLYLPTSIFFDEKNIDTTMQKFKRNNLEICCLSSGIVLTTDDCVKKAAEYIDLAQKIGARYIRVMGEDSPQAKQGTDYNLIISNLKEISKIAKSVIVLLESNGIFADTKLLKKALDEISSPNIAALWDVNHPFRFFNETPQQTFDNLKDYIKHIHIKDSKIENGKICYKLIGQGDMPIKEIVTILKQNNYDGYLSLEWTKLWNPDLEEAGIAFVQYINEMKML